MHRGVEASLPTRPGGFRVPARDHGRGRRTSTLKVGEGLGMDVADLVKAGDLASARTILLERVKAAPADPIKRFELAELLLITGEFERADNHFDLVSSQDVTWATPIALVRQLIR